MTDGRSTTGGMSQFAITRLNEQSGSFDGFAAAYRFEIAIRDLDDRPLKTVAYVVTPGYFDIFAKPMAVGRGFLEEEHPDGEPNFVVLSHRLWTNAYNADPSIVGAAIPAGPGSLTVVGVASPDFDYPVGADIWLAIRPPPNQPANVLEGVGRLTQGVTFEQGQVELDLFASRFAEESNSFRNRVMRIRDLQESIVGDTSTTLLILFGAAATLLLIACANVMNLLLSRGETRTREVALRAALGASGWRLIGQLLVESMTLAAIGALLGLAGTWLSLKVLDAIGPGELPRLAEIQIDGSVLLFTVVATALTGLVFGMLPAARLVAADIKSLMGGSSRGASGGRGGARVFDALVLAQTGLAVTLVIGAGLLVRSYQRLQSADAGFAAESVLVMDVNLSRANYPDIRGVALIYEQALAEIAELPGVTAVGAASTLPMGEQVDFFQVVVVLGMETSDEPERVRYRHVAPGFFESLDIELREGRLLEQQDREDVGGVVVVNQAFVDLVLGDTPPLGQRIIYNGFPDDPAFVGNVLGTSLKTEYEIVGVVEDVKYYGLGIPAEPSLYFSQSQFVFRRMWVTARVEGREATSLVDDLRTQIRELDPTLPISFSTMEDIVSQSLGTERLSMLLLLAFGLAATTLAAIGIYGVISLSVSRRTTEMAIRAALGAEPNTVLWLSMKRGMTVAGAGLAVGIGGAVLGKQVLASQLYEISATDPLVMVGAPMVLAIVVCIAVLIPALRTTRINLSHTLRTE